MAAGLLSFSCSILLFFEHARVQLAVLEPFMEKVFFFFGFSDDPTVSVVISCQLPQIVLRAFRPGPYPKQCSLHLPVQSPLAGGKCEHLGYFSTGICSQACNMWVLFSYLFFLLVMLPSEIPKLPTDPPVRGFPGVWKRLLFEDSLPGMDLCP